ncbi:MAG: hypothetical protein Ct9H300mP28_11650 [Pseudomonadota bacterium]|nr:MAG: hypothetical protein Ct9H300mP28_11650 [Pseudomonadota bacterium]
MRASPDGNNFPRKARLQEIPGIVPPIRILAKRMPVRSALQFCGESLP